MFALTIFTIFSMCISRAEVIELNKLSKQEDLDKYVGQHIKVRGTIGNYGGSRYRPTDATIIDSLDRWERVWIDIGFTNDTIAPTCINLQEPDKSTYSGEAVVSGVLQKGKTWDQSIIYFMLAEKIEIT